MFTPAPSPLPPGGRSTVHARRRRLQAVGRRSQAERRGRCLQAARPAPAPPPHPARAMSTAKGNRPIPLCSDAMLQSFITSLLLTFCH